MLLLLPTHIFFEFQETLPGAAQSPVIAFGGSYGGRKTGFGLKLFFCLKV